MTLQIAYFSLLPFYRKNVCVSQKNFHLFSKISDDHNFVVLATIHIVPVSSAHFTTQQDYSLIETSLELYGAGAQAKVTLELQPSYFEAKINLPYVSIGVVNTNVFSLFVAVYVAFAIWRLS